jgi:hypothetical protein
MTSRRIDYLENHICKGPFSAEKRPKRRLTKSISSTRTCLLACFLSTRTTRRGSCVRCLPSYLHGQPFDVQPIEKDRKAQQECQGLHVLSDSNPSEAICGRSASPDISQTLLILLLLFRIRDFVICQQKEENDRPLWPCARTDLSRTYQSDPLSSTTIYLIPVLDSQHRLSSCSTLWVTLNPPTRP